MTSTTTEPPFVGAKIALLIDGRVLTILRDDIATIPYPDMWELPGGGREGDEPPAACALRETHEELGLVLPQSRLVWRRAFPSHRGEGSVGWFFAARLTSAEVAGVRLGDEGQAWRMMEIGTFLTHPRAVPFLQDRLRLCLAEIG